MLLFDIENNSSNTSITKSISTTMTFRACGSCFSLDVYPYLGFETGRQYECKSCGMISPVVIEFDNIEALKAFKDAENKE